MNKQEQIEKMAKETQGCEYDDRNCEDCWQKQQNECTYYIVAKSLVGSGYINGADFVEWLKENAVSMTAHGAEYIAVGRLAEALQEYLKGE